MKDKFVLGVITFYGCEGRKWSFGRYRHAEKLFVLIKTDKNATFYLGIERTNLQKGHFMVARSHLSLEISSAHRSKHNFYDFRVGFDKTSDNLEIDSICHQIVRCRDKIIYLGSLARYTCQASLLKCFLNQSAKWRRK